MEHQRVDSTVQSKGLQISVCNPFSIAPGGVRTQARTAHPEQRWCMRTNTGGQPAPRRRLAPDFFGTGIAKSNRRLVRLLT
jgi:hypothetical protein